VRALFGDVGTSEVENGWEERWREFHHGVVVGPLWVGPPWESVPPGALAVLVEPGRAFGTGAHPTTRLCLDLLAGLPRGSLLDVGCGSGVLAIAAAKLGFAPIFAVDHDPAAVEATRANADANGVEVEVRGADATSGTLAETDTTIANLTLEDVRTLAPLVRSAHLVTSGYLEADRAMLEGWTLARRQTLEGWAADLWMRAEG
jgi:ribosomal protein L11 methyltransferase